MKLLRQVAIIVSICFIGEILHRVLNIPIPGNVIGLILLFICLQTKLIKLSMIQEFSDFLLNHLAFFFIPAGVGLMASTAVLSGKWLAFLGICLITTFIVMGSTGHTVQLLKRRKNNE